MLNTLIGVNNNRIACCKYAERETSVKVFKDLFARLHDTSMNCRAELAYEVYKLGGVPKEETMATEEFLKAWNEVHAGFMNKDYKAVLNSFCYEEGVVVKTYENVLKKEESIPTWHQPLLYRQYQALVEDSIRMKNLRDAFAK